MQRTAAFLFGLLLPGLLLAAGSGPVQRDHLQAELVSRVDSVQPGTALEVGLRLLPDPGWHTYWKNPGDSGQPTEIAWTLPEGVIASGIRWPFPEAMPIAHLINYGYDGEHLLPVTLEIPDELPLDRPLRIEAFAEWLVCEEICIPGEATLELTLPVSTAEPEADPGFAELFAWADRRQPELADWPARYSSEGGQLSLQIDVGERDDSSRWAFFSAVANVVDHAQPATISAGEGQLLVSQALSPFARGVPDPLEFVLVDTTAERAWQLRAEAGALISTGDSAAAPTPPLSWPFALVLALLGGLLLNLMPCVFPVLSIKALSLVEHADGDSRGHGLAYTAGVILSFSILAGVLLALRAGGEAVGWGFQLQSPWIVGALIYVLFALGLSLSGLVQFGTSLMGAGQGLAERSGRSGSFFTGVLAVIVASPCTAPAMGSALGAAVFMPWPMALSVFIALGLGLALPMLLLSFLPALGRWLPRPGPWMETFKQAMAFPLYLAVVWLLWVLARQTDANGLAAILLGLVALAFTLWLLGKRDRGPTLSVIRHLAIVAGLVVSLASLGAAVRFQSAPAEAADRWWEAYSAERLSELRADPERAVFVNMTADWCVTCLVNEQVALSTEAVREAFAANGVVYMKGDWTRRDAAITDYLAEYGRNGVPLYVVYPRDGGEPRILPQVLTPGLVIEALESL
ncbi:protein-disulfide reductase DsbD family protein [Wenzhouxiangella marina]|uniref:Thiol:disulfide interchange protein n=1 Tax=Wenzhouxiangella marina TaxID=1579979 RepID=A0A0K0XRY8_9GAMM|nr:protein-disulfide reductase DsbD domain-containing protein [Wenzhouxiangella marina]AKS40420.1 thiol:disulfide interchange protein [Wenzhouxiangella marina]MBB6088258.1 thiol:disulfide interchange protein DsbD [Wenzhouxiangella marina]